MKKIIACLGALTLTATSSLAVVSCGETNPPTPDKHKSHNDIVNDLIITVTTFLKGGIYSVSDDDYKSITADKVSHELQIAVIDQNTEYKGSFTVVSGSAFTKITPIVKDGQTTYQPGQYAFKIMDLATKAPVKFDGKNQDEMQMKYLTNQINIINLLSTNIDNSPQQLKINNLTLKSLTNIFSDITHMAIPDWIFSGVVSDEMTLSNIFGVLNEVLSSSGVLPYLMNLRGKMPKLEAQPNGNVGDSDQKGDIAPGSFMKLFNKMNEIVPTLKLFGDNVKSLKDIELKKTAPIIFHGKKIDLHIDLRMDNIVKSIAPDLVHLVNFIFQQTALYGNKESVFLLILKYFSMPVQNIPIGRNISKACDLVDPDHECDDFTDINNDDSTKAMVHSNLDNLLFDIFGDTSNARMWHQNNVKINVNMPITGKMPWIGETGVGYDGICDNFFKRTDGDMQYVTLSDVINGHDDGTTVTKGILPQLFKYKDITKILHIESTNIKSMDSFDVNFAETWQEFIKIWLYKKNINRNVLNALSINVFAGQFGYEVTTDGVNYMPIDSWTQLIDPSVINFRAHVSSLQFKISTKDANVQRDFSPFDFSVLFD